MLLWLVYWNLFNKGYNKKKKKVIPNTRALWILTIFALSFRPLLDILSSNGAFPEVPLQSEPLIGSRFFVLFDILANLTFTQKGGGTKERRVRKARGRGEQRGLSSDVFAEES